MNRVNWTVIAEDLGFQTSNKQPWGCSKDQPSSRVAGCLTQERTLGTRQRLGNQGPAGMRLNQPGTGRGGGAGRKGEAGFGWVRSPIG